MLNEILAFEIWLGHWILLTISTLAEITLKLFKINFYCFYNEIPYPIGFRALFSRKHIFHDNKKRIFNPVLSIFDIWNSNVFYKIQQTSCKFSSKPSCKTKHFDDEKQQWKINYFLNCIIIYFEEKIKQKRKNWMFLYIKSKTLVAFSVDRRFNKNSTLKSDIENV